MLPIAQASMKGKQPILFVTNRAPVHMKKVNKKVLIEKDFLAPYKNAEGVAIHPNVQTNYEFRGSYIPKMPKLHKLKSLKISGEENIFTSATSFRGCSPLKKVKAEVDRRHKAKESLIERDAKIK